MGERQSKIKVKRLDPASSVYLLVASSDFKAGYS